MCTSSIENHWITAKPDILLSATSYPCSEAQSLGDINHKEIFFYRLLLNVFNTF